MKTSIRLVLVFLAVLMVLVGFLAVNMVFSLKEREDFVEKIPHPKDSAEECDFHACSSDLDCVKVDAKNDCCGCNYGGSAAAINDACRSEWNKECRAESRACPAVISNDPSCLKEAKCVQGECVLK